MIKVGIIGASGMAGRTIYQLAAAHPELAVTGIVRHEGKARKVLGNDAQLLSGDIFAMIDSLLARFDVIIDAFGTNPADAARHIQLAEKLIGLARQKKLRLIFILGAGSLRTGADQHLLVDDLEKLPNAGDWINVPRQQVKELQYLEAVTDVDWVGISPAATFEPGPAADYRLGKDELLFNDQGESKVTTGTMAEVVINEILAPQFHQERFTVVNTSE